MSRSALALVGLTLLAAGCGPSGIDPALTAADLDRPEPSPTPTQVPLPTGVTLRAGTYNLHGGGDGTPEAIGAALAALDLDVVGLQECPEALAAEVASAGGFAHHYAEGGQAILSHGPLSDPSRHPLNAGRSFVHANLEHEGITFSIYDAHIGWNAEGDLQAREMVDEHIARDDNPYLVVVGDFNDEHYSSQIRILEEALIDAFFVAGVRPGARISWPATGFDGSEGSQLIDLVFASPKLRPIVAAVDVVNLVPVLSDHKPAWAELLFPYAGEPAFDEDPLAASRDYQRALPAPAERPDNRLRNPGAEQGLDGWSASGGFTTAEERDHQRPRSGDGLFTGFARPDRVGYARATQSIGLGDVAEAVDAGRVELWVEGWMATGYAVRTASGAVANAPRPYDDAEMLLELYDAEDRRLARVSSARRDTLDWHPWARTIEVPPGTRRAQVILHAHHKPASGTSDDAVFDDLYVGVKTLDEAHPRMGADLVTNGGAETLQTEGWQSEAIEALEDQTPLGVMLYPPWTASGRGCFVSWRNREEAPRVARMSQDLDLEAHAGALEAGELTLRWGATLRTLRGEAELRLSLQVLDEDGSVFATLSASPLRAPEWTDVTSRTWIPPGASGARLVLEVQRDAPGAAGFADALFAWPERGD